MVNDGVQLPIYHLITGDTNNKGIFAPKALKHKVYHAHVKHV